MKYGKCPYNLRWFTSVVENKFSTTDVKYQNLLLSIETYCLWKTRKIIIKCHLLQLWLALLASTVFTLSVGTPYLLTIPPASVAQLDASPTGDQEVAGSTPAEVGNILSWRLIMKIFSTVILSLPLIQEGQLSVSCERMCTILVNHLED